MIGARPVKAFTLFRPIDIALLHDIVVNTERQPKLLARNRASANKWRFYELESCSSCKVKTALTDADSSSNSAAALLFVQSC